MFNLEINLIAILLLKLLAIKITTHKLSRVDLWNYVITYSRKFLTFAQSDNIT